MQRRKFSRKLKDAFRPFFYKLRGINYPLRTPDFFVLGATRAGSTFLYNFLKTSPDIFLPQKKELKYFNNDGVYKENIKNYYPLFHGYKEEKLIGEVTPLYLEEKTLFDKNGTLYYDARDSATSRINNHAPDAKMIISLRDPIDRIRSIYKKNFAQGKTPATLEEEIRKELTGAPSSKLISRNQYDKHIRTVLKNFPQDQVCIIFFEEWTKDISKTQEQICTFLNIEPWDFNLSDLGSDKRNTSLSYIEKNKGRSGNDNISKELTEQVSELLRPSKIYLENITNRNINFWKI